MVNLSISNQYKKYIDKAWLNQVVNTTLTYEEVDYENSDLSILVRNDEFLRKLKNKYFGINETTDVLSFPAGDEDPESHRMYLGDIIVSLPQTQRQAEAAGKTLQQEFALLIVHGILHLLGFDHADESTQQEMWAHQDAILKEINKGTVHA